MLCVTEWKVYRMHTCLCPPSSLRPQEVRLPGIISTALTNGVVNLVGMGAALVGLQAALGSLLGKTLTAAPGPWGVAYRPTGAPPVALDVFSVQVSNGWSVFVGWFRMRAYACSLSSVLLGIELAQPPNDSYPSTSPGERLRNHGPLLRHCARQLASPRRSQVCWGRSGHGGLLACTISCPAQRGGGVPSFPIACCFHPSKSTSHFTGARLPRRKPPSETLTIATNPLRRRSTHDEFFLPCKKRSLTYSLHRKGQQQ